jgi:SAM-dependent methyltransferase
MNEAEYVARLVALQDKRWKQVLRVQRPYQRNILRHCTGPTLDVGCGIGRNLKVLPQGSVGVDTNRFAVAEAQRRGMTAVVADEFQSDPAQSQGEFSAVLFSHVLEHVSRDDAVGLVSDYRRFVRPGGVVVVVCPQEVGYASDETHTDFVDFEAAEAILNSAGVEVRRQYSFPFPRPLGRWFIYNEFITVGRLPD